MPQGAIYDGWMFYFIQDCLKGTLINWSKIISDNLDFQLRNVERSRSFAMTSYLVYLLARFVTYKGLICRGEVGNGQGQFRSYECYPQLNMYRIEDYKRE